MFLSLPGQLGLRYDGIIESQARFINIFSFDPAKSSTSSHATSCIEWMDLDSQLSSKTKTCPPEDSAVSIQVLKKKMSLCYGFFYDSCKVLFQAAQAKNTRVLALRELRPQRTIQMARLGWSAKRTFQVRSKDHPGRGTWCRGGYGLIWRLGWILENSYRYLWIDIDLILINDSI